MRANIRSMLLFAATASMPIGLAAAQVAPAPGATPQAAPAPTPQAIPPAATVPAPPPAPVVLPPPVWQISDVQQLLDFIRNIGSEGLDPRDYDPDGLVKALQAGDAMAISSAATDRFNKVSWDLALGRVRGKDRLGWHIVDKDLDQTTQRQMLEVALATRRVVPVLQSLLPTHPQYGSLKTALSIAKPADTALVNRIKLNMDRWRWLPRDLGQKYIIVNVPAFYATLVENGATRWKQRAVAGALKTPTPQISALARGVILNPWWEVPKSIEGEVRGKAGYVPVKGKDGKIQRWRQPPGPANALGQMKFVMPNAEAIFLHDTNAKSRFNSQVRALSHGCIRTQKIHDLAAELGSDDGGEWTRAKIDEAIASKKTVEAKFVKPVPVFIVYFSVAALTDGTITTYSDLYKRDAKVIAALLGGEGKLPGKPAEKVATN